MENNEYLDYDQPSYNIKAVSQMVGLLPVTLRAWERRYGLPSPSRGGQGYRLYSEHDIQTLRWLKSQIDAGMNVGQAAHRLHQLVDAGKDPASVDILHVEHSLSMNGLQQQISMHLKQFNAAAAADVLRQAFNTYSVEDVFSNLIEPVLIRMGEEWHNGTLTIAEEHFVTEFFQEQLFSLLTGTVKPFRIGTIVAACMPGEHHQLGLLMLVILLRMRGWNVVFMGPNLPFDRLAEVINSLNPRLMLFSATMPASAEHAAKIMDMLKDLQKPAPKIILGGQGFNEFSRRSDIPHSILSGTRADMITTMENLMAQGNKG